MESCELEKDLIRYKSLPDTSTEQVIESGTSILSRLTGNNYIADGWITALNAGDSIVSSYIDDSYTSFTVIPEPATLSLVALLGGGMLWIRKRFMI